jgi:hypothetical protein
MGLSMISRVQELSRENSHSQAYYPIEGLGERKQESCLRVDGG